MQEYVPDFEDTWFVQNRAGNWSFRWTVPKEFSTTGRSFPREISCRTKDRREAEIFRIEWFNAEKAISVALETPTVDKLIEEYIRLHVVPNGVAGTQVSALRAVSRKLGARKASTIKAADATLYRQERLAEGVKDGTIRRELGALRAVIAFAVEQELWPRDAYPPKLGLPPGSKPRKVHVDEDKEAVVFDTIAGHYLAAVKIENPTPKEACRERVALFAILALSTAARSGAIEGLTVDRVDLVNGLVDYKDPDLPVKKKRRAVVPVSDRLRPILAVAVKRAKDKGWKHLLGKSTFTKKLWREYRKELGLDHITRHDLRRTFASLAAMSGVPLYEIANVLADSYGTTERNYAHLAPAFLRSAVNRGRPEKTN